VVKSAVASMTYHHDETLGPTWEFQVASHPEWMRRIDGRTCAIRFKPPK
jgi:hypothetical protein